MQTYLTDRLAISDLINGWMYRDLGEWDRLFELFHADGTIEVTWFEGGFSEFVQGSMRMGASDIRTKHVIGSPVVQFNGTRAIAETNAIIIGENAKLDIGCVAHSRFYDRVEKRNNTWKIAQRSAIYDMGSFSFPKGIVALDASIVQKYPREYAPLAYVLEVSGFPVNRVFPTKGSDQEKAIKAAGETWLAEAGGRE